MRLAHMRIDVAALLPAFDADEMAGLADAFMHVVGEAAMLAAGRGDAVMGGGDEQGAGVRAHLRPGDDENGIGHR